MGPVKFYYIVLQKTNTETGMEYSVVSQNSKYELIKDLEKEAYELNISYTHAEELPEKLIEYWNKNQIRNSFQITMHSLAEISDDDLTRFLELYNY